MSALATTQQPATPAIKPRPPVISRAVREAIRLMVEEGLTFDKAAVQCEMSVRNMRLALERPHVLRYLRECKQVFRASVSASNISALAKIRDESGNAMAQLGAIKVLEQLDEEHTPGAAAKALPGLQIVIVQGGSAAPAMVDVTPQRLAHD